jgi:hypothetical protein
VPAPPQRWTEAELKREAEAARRIFVKERRKAVKEELATYRRLVAEYERAARDLLTATSDLTKITGKSLQRRPLLNIARYAAVPTISKDDLDNLTDAKFGNWLGQTTDRGARPSSAEFNLAAQIVKESLDPVRAPWLSPRRSARAQERKRFATMTAVIPAATGLSSARRNRSAARQEEATRAACQAAKYQLVEPRGTLTDPEKEMPAASFSNPRTLNRTRMDVPIRLRDGHGTGLKFLAVEAKVSNSALNSRKRLIEVSEKGAKWDASGKLYSFRTAAVLAGDFSVERLQEAQDGGIWIFWEHRLADLTRFLK